MPTRKGRRPLGWSRQVAFVDPNALKIPDRNSIANKNVQVDENASQQARNSPISPTPSSNGFGNDSDSEKFTTGDLYWGRIQHFTYWACIVCPDESDRENRLVRTVDQQLEVHVRFFADHANRSWVKRENMIIYRGLEFYREQLKEFEKKLGAKSYQFQSLLPKKSKLKIWLEAVKEADIIANTPYPQRLQKFFEMSEATKDRNREERGRRKSMSTPRSESKSEDSKSAESRSESKSWQPRTRRNRSESPVATPAVPPKRPPKRRKTTTNTRELIQLRSVTKAASQSIPDPSSPSNIPNNSLDVRNGSNQMENSKEFQDFYKTIKDFILDEGNANETIEQNLLATVQNIWDLKSALRQNGSKAEVSRSKQKPLKLLSKRLKDMKKRQYPKEDNNNSIANKIQPSSSHQKQNGPTSNAVVVDATANIENGGMSEIQG